MDFPLKQNPKWICNTIIKSQFERRYIYMAFNPTVDEEKCAGCEECVDVCPVEVFEMQDGKSVPVNAEECLGCESCVEVCEEGAITVEEI